MQNSRFKNVQFEGNSLKSNGQSNQGNSNNEDVDNVDQDLFDQHRVTTYNPNKMTGKQRIIRPNPGRFPHYEGDPNLNDKTIFEKTPAKISNRFKSAMTDPKNAAYHDSSTEYKTMLDLEPLLEDDISDIPSFRELMKNTNSSHDVQVIKFNHSDEKYDSNPSASSMDSDNIQKEELPAEEDLEPTSEHTISNKGTKEVTQAKKQSQELDENLDHEDHNSKEENEEDIEYADYYDDDPTPTPRTTTPKPHSTEDYEEYDGSEETDPTPVHSTENTTPNSKTKEDPKESFDVVAMKPNKTMVQDDNFKEFVDTSVIDETEHNIENDDTETNTETSISSQEVSSVDTMLRQEVVSVVTTKSVVNGTISVPDFTNSPGSTITSVTTQSSSTPIVSSDSNSSIPMTTENWIVVASVQTSRSVSGARFLPFPTVKQDEKKQVLADENDEEGDFEGITENPKEQSESSGIPQTTSMSTENLNDKLDSIQSELSSAVLSGSLNSDKNIEIITESTTIKQPTTTTSSTTTTTTTTTTQSPKLFTLRSTEIPLATERSNPDPLPVLIKKFTPRVSTTSSTTTPKPKKKLVTIMDDLSGLLPAGYKPRMSYKDKRTSTTTSTTTTTTTAASVDLLSSDEENANGTQGRSSGISSKNKVIIRDHKSPFVPKDFKNKELKPRDETNNKVNQDSLIKLLPPGYKPPKDSSESKDTKPSILDKVEKIDISAFLPKGFNFSTTTTEKPLVPKAVPVDLSALLPTGFKLNSTEIEAPQLPIKNIKIADVTNLLPPGFTLSTTEEPEKTTPKAPAPGGFKLVFPSRPGNKATRKSTTPRTMPESGPSPVTPKIQKGWPTR